MGRKRVGHGTTKSGMERHFIVSNSDFHQGNFDKYTIRYRKPKK
jgi:hypothetical protein